MAQPAIDSEAPTKAAGRVSAHRRVLLGWLALAAVFVLWGTTYNAIALGDRTVPPLFLAGTRFLVAGLVLLPIASRDRAPWRVPRRQWLSAVITGLLMLAGGNGLVTVAETRVPGGIAALLVATVPIWTLLIDAAVSRTRLRVPAMLGILVGLAGVVVRVRPTPSLHIDLVGAGVVMLAAILWSAGTVHSKRPNGPRSPFLAASMQMLGAGVALLLAGLATGEAGAAHPAQIGWTGVLSLAWLVVGGSLGGYVCLLIALRRLPIAVVSTYAFVNLLISVVVGFAFFGEPLDVQVGIAALCTVVAIAALLLSRRGESAAGH